MIQISTMTNGQISNLVYLPLQLQKKMTKQISRNYIYIGIIIYKNYVTT